jgi:hypothetical protein
LGPLIFALSAGGVLLFFYLVFIEPTNPNFKSTLGFDAYAYWNVDLQHPYSVALGGYGNSLYSPAFALIASPAHLLPFNVFFIFWDAFLFVNLIWLTRRWALAWLLFLPVSLELFNGNIHLLLATVCVLGFEYPALWSIGLLTKVTPGVSLLWFVVRREWRSLAWALGATALISAVAFVLVPSAWFDWLKFLIKSANTGAGSNDWYGFLFPPLVVRLGLAALLVIWGARTDRRWVLPLATVISVPVLWITTPAILMALPRLRSKAAVNKLSLSDLRFWKRRGNANA